MKLTNLAKPFFAASVLAAVLSMGCAAQTEGEVSDDGAQTGSTQQDLTGAEGMSIASGTFGIVNGAFTAYVTLDNFIKYGAPSPNDKILGDLKTANDALKSLQASQAEQFNQLKVDNIILSINDIEDKIDRAYGEYDNSSDKANFVPSELKWSDFDMLSNRIASVNGTTDAFTLVKDGMLEKTGGIVDDPLGVYALRMRTRLAQAAFLLSVKTPMNADQQQSYDSAVKSLETSFAKSTRAYFIAKVAPAMASGTVSDCYSRFWTGDYAYDTPGGNTNGGWDSYAVCSMDSMKWSTLTILNSRVPLVNTVASEQDALTTGKWKRHPGTVVVKSASLTTSYGTTDITKSMNLVCNSVENCSIPESVQAAWLGGNSRRPGTDKYTVVYSCGDDKGDRTVTTEGQGKAVVLACNPATTVAGVYESSDHDATTGRGDDDAMVVENVSPTRWSYKLKDGTQGWFEQTDPTHFQTFTTDAGGTVKVTWNQDGRVIRIGRPGGTASQGFNFVSAAQQ